LVCQGVRIAIGEDVPDRGPPDRVVDGNEAPRLAQPDRWRQSRQFEELLQHGSWDGIAAKMAHVTPPAEQLDQLAAEDTPEIGHAIANTIARSRQRRRMALRLSALRDLAS
jgi:hypothetical protein